MSNMTDQQQAVVRSRRYQLHKARQVLRRNRCKPNEVDVSWAAHNLWRAEQEAA